MDQNEITFNFTVNFAARKKQVLEENSVPKRLYKYFSKEAIDDWLFPKPSLRYTPPNFLNDPYEVLPALDLEISEKNFVDELKYLEPETTDEEVEKFLDIVKYYRTLYNYQHYKKFWENNDVGILSMTANPVSVPMWAYYASGNSGAVFEIDITNDIICSLFFCTPFKKVQYKHRRPVDNTKNLREAGQSLYDEINTWFFTKSVEWQHEDEYRSTTFCASFLKQSKGVVGTFIIPPSAVTAVYVGIRTTGDTLKKIVTYCEQNNIFCGRIRHDVKEYRLLLPDKDEPLSDPML